jgi:hypothetical protein
MNKETNIVYQDLIETELLKRFSYLMSSLIERRDGIDKKGKIYQKPDYETSLKDEYAENVFKVIMNIVNTCKQLEFIPIFIRRYPLRKFYKAKGINQPQYIQYHYENHFLKISTIFDLSIILVSEVYCLGIPAKLTSLNQLVVNSHTKQSNSVKILKQFDKSIQGIRSIRNSISHRGDFFDKDINDVDNYFFLWDNPYNDNDENDIREFVLKSRMKELIKNKEEKLRHNNLHINDIITNLFKIILIEFNLRYDKI